MEVIKDSDQKARDSIVNDIYTNIFVEASAGSGKTTSLVNRMVAMVEKGIPVDQICTITFTIAAADEFFERFQKLLSRRTIYNPEDPSIKDLGDTTEETRKYCLEALNNIDSCFSGTMDSFCNMVAHELPNEIGIPSDAEIISEQQRNDFIKSLFFRMLTDPNHPLYQEAGRFNATLVKPFESFINGVEQLYPYRGYKIEYDTDMLESSTNHLIDKEVDELIRLLKLIKDEGLEYIGSKEARNNTSFAVNTIIRPKLGWKANAKKIGFILKSLKYKVEDPKDAVKYSSGVEGSTLETDYLTPQGKSYVYTEEIIKDLDVINKAVNEYYFQIFYSFIDKAMDEIVLEMKKTSQFTFFDFLYYLTKKFKEDSGTQTRELIKHVYERHSHILIDESQDTDPMQTQLFFYLTGLISTDNWELVEPQPGSLFIVGDPKQSIYKFRGADVNSYNRVKEVFANFGEIVTLSKNFRSNVVLKEYFNDVMNDVLDVKGMVLKHPDIPIDKTSPRAKIEEDPDITLNGVYKYHTKNDKKEDAVQVAELIKKIVKNDKYKIVSKASNDIRTIDYKDILVITRDKNIAPFIEKFAEYNIPLRVEAKIFFNNSETVSILKKLVYLLFEPYKIQNFVQVVRSCLYGLDTTDIIQMKLDGFNLDISNISDEEGNSIKFTEPQHEEIVKELNKLYVDTRGMSVSSTLLYLLSNKDFVFFNHISSEFLDYAYFMIELVKAAEKDGTIVSFDDAKHFLENSISDDSDVEKIMKLSNDIDQVKISNLHKVKGLQAPIVILAKPYANEHETNMYVDRNNKTVYFNSAGYKSEFGLTIPIARSERHQDKIDIAQIESNAEERRVEYVAATRAESVLFIGKADEDKNNPWGHLLKDDFDVIPDYDPVKQELKQELYDDVIKDFNSIVNDNCNKASYINRSPSELRLKTTVTNVDTVKEKEDLDIDIPKTELGTLIHRLLECIVTSENTFDIYSLVDSIFDEYEYSKDEKLSLYNLLTSVGIVFTKTGFVQTSDAVPQNLFEVLMNAEDVMCEVPFAYRSGDAIVSGIIDLLYKDSYGWHVIDYKTNMEGDIATLEEDYKGQLDVYRKAVKQATGLDCDAHIYHIETVDF